MRIFNTLFPHNTKKMETIKKELIEVRNKIDGLIKQLVTKQEEIACSKPKGRPKSIIFCKEVDENQLANSIMNLHQQYFNETYNAIEVNGECYSETNFMLCVYFALVKLQLAHSTKFHQINKQYYSFLTNKCCIKLVDKERTYNNHLNKVVRTGVDLHCLTEEIVNKKRSKGVIKLEELAIWHQMLTIAESLLVKDEYIHSLAKK